MNPVYSTVWSETRGTYVVTHEKNKAKGKPSTTRKVVAQAVTAALLALGAGQAIAQGCPTASVNLITLREGLHNPHRSES